MNERHYISISMVLVSFMVIIAMVSILLPIGTSMKVVLLVLALAIFIGYAIIMLAMYKDLLDINTVIKKFRVDRSLRLDEGGIMKLSKKNVNELLAEIDDDEIQISHQDIKDSISASKMLCNGVIDGNIRNDYNTTRLILGSLDKCSNSIEVIELGRTDNCDEAGGERCHLIDEIIELSASVSIPDVSIIMDLPYSRDGIVALLPASQVSKAFHSVISSVSSVGDFEELEIGISSVVNMRGHFSNAKLAIACKAPDQKPHVSTITQRNAKKFLKWTYDSDIILDKVISNENGLLVTFYIPISPKIKLKDAKD